MTKEQTQKGYSCPSCQGDRTTTPMQVITTRFWYCVSCAIYFDLDSCVVLTDNDILRATGGTDGSGEI